MFLNPWWLMPVLLVLAGVTVWVSRHFHSFAERTRKAEERRLEIVSQLARGEPLEAILALLTRSLETAFGRIRCTFTLAGPIYSLAANPSEQLGGTIFQIVDTKGASLGALTIHPALAELTRDETRAVHEVRHLAEMIAEQQSTYGELQILAKHDRLTGLMNASTFDSTLGRLIETALPETTVALFVFDLDGFRQIYARLGRSASDIYLQQAAERIKHCFRPGDAVARSGADDFAALAVGLSAADAGQVCKSVVDAFGIPFTVDGLRIASSVRIGVSAFPQGGRTPAELNISAKAALSDAKKGIGSQYTISSHEIRERARIFTITEQLISQALDDNRFDLLYQPQLTLDGELAGMEALVRARYPEQLMSGASSSQSDSNSGAWVLPEALRQYAEWHRKGLSPARIAIKHSQVALSYSDLYDQILSHLKTFELGPHAIQIELPDSAMASADETALQALWQLRSAGISVAVCGSLANSCLDGLPVDAIKISASLVRVLTESDDSMTRMSSVIASAHASRMTVIAEGVETEPQMWLLRRLGCDVLQGRHISLPLNASAAGDVLGARAKTQTRRLWSQKSVNR